MTMDNLARLYRTVSWSILLAAFAASFARSAPVEKPTDKSWFDQLLDIRTIAMSRARPAAQPKQYYIRAAAEPAARPTPSPSPTPLPQGGAAKKEEVSNDLAKAENKHLQTRLQFNANGWKIWAS